MTKSETSRGTEGRNERGTTKQKSFIPTAKVATKFIKVFTFCKLSVVVHQVASLLIK